MQNMQYRFAFAKKCFTKAAILDPQRWKIVLGHITQLREKWNRRRNGDDDRGDLLHH